VQYSPVLRSTTSPICVSSERVYTAPFPSFSASRSTLTPVSHLFQLHTPTIDIIGAIRIKGIPRGCGICPSPGELPVEACSHANKTRHRRREEVGNKSVASCLTGLDLRSVELETGTGPLSRVLFFHLWDRKQQHQGAITQPPIHLRF
jgi:hypothetical protein